VHTNGVVLVGERAIGCEEFEKTLLRRLRALRKGRGSSCNLGVKKKKKTQKNTTKKKKTTQITKGSGGGTEKQARQRPGV